MSIILIILHVVVCLALIMIVLLQTGKGAGMGAAFGGASQTVFGSAGSAGFMGKLTTGAAVIFMVTSLTLGYFTGDKVQSSIMKDSAVEELGPEGEALGEPEGEAVGEPQEAAPPEGAAGNAAEQGEAVDGDEPPAQAPAEAGATASEAAPTPAPAPEGAAPSPSGAEEAATGQ